MPDLLHIARSKLRRSLNFTIDWRTANLVKHASSILVFGGFAVAAYLLTRMTVDYLLDTERLGLFLLHRYVSMLLFVFFLSINVGNIIVSFATFYRSPEMVFYLTKPVSHTNVFVLKFIDNFFYSSTALLLIAAAVLGGYGFHFHEPWTFYVQTMAFGLLPFMLLSACVAVTLLLLLMRFADVVGLQRIIGILVLLYLGSLYGYFSLTNPVRLQARVMQFYPHLDQYFGYLDPPIAKFMPNHWLAESLYWTMRGDPSYALSYTLLLLGSTGVMCAVMILAAKKYFYAGWLSSLNVRIAGEPRLPLLRRFSLTRPPRLESQTSVLLKKEFWQFVWEPSQWIHLGIISILVVTFVASISQVDLNQPEPFFQTVSYIVVFLFNAFLVASIALRFVYPAISIEGVNFWAVLSAPVNSRKVFWLKYMIAFLPTLAISEALVIFSHRTLSHYSILVPAALLVMMCVTVALVALNLGAGSYFTNFKEKNPIRVASSQSATVTFVISILYITAVVAILFLPYSNYFISAVRGDLYSSASLYSALAAVAFISAATSGIMLAVGIKALTRDY